MNYAGFALPMWHWLRGFQSVPTASTPIPSGPPGWHAALEVRCAERRVASLGADAAPVQPARQPRGAGASARAVSGNAELHRLAAAVQFTYPGLPAGSTHGDQIGMADSWGWGGRMGDEARGGRRHLRPLHRAPALLRSRPPPGGVEAPGGRAGHLRLPARGVGGAGAGGGPRGRARAAAGLRRAGCRRSRSATFLTARCGTRRSPRSSRRARPSGWRSGTEVGQGC